MTGFTKTETLIVAVITSSLGLLALYHFNQANAKARDFERKEQIKSVASILEDYLIDNGAYPPSTGKKQFTGCGDPLCPIKNNAGIPCNWHQNATPNSLACGEYIYMNPVPRAPKNPKYKGLVTHHYQRLESRKIVLETCLELKNDIEARPVNISQTGFTPNDCRSGVIFQIVKDDTETEIQIQNNE
jgi:type II secretory pathway pseudopilin PulG